MLSQLYMSGLNTSSITNTTYHCFACYLRYPSMRELAATSPVLVFPPVIGSALRGAK